MDESDSETLAFPTDVLLPPHYRNAKELSALLQNQNPNWKLAEQLCPDPAIVLVRVRVHLSDLPCFGLMCPSSRPKTERFSDQIDNPSFALQRG